MKWRAIVTDTENLSGVAPVCKIDHPVGCDAWVYDCCPGPFIECCSEEIAEQVSQMLTLTNATILTYY
jgi:hypothetical protein